MKIKYKKIDPRATTPKYNTPGDSGMDLHAILESPVILGPGETFAFSTGIAFEIPEGYEGQVRPRSGMSFKQSMLCSLGTVDSPYRGEVKVKLYNHSFSTWKINNGDRVAQIVFCPVLKVELEEVSELSDTVRGTNGFGHSGV